MHDWIKFTLQTCILRLEKAEQSLEQGGTPTEACCEMLVVRNALKELLDETPNFNVPKPPRVAVVGERNRRERC